jgi:hypothetical protein
MTIPAALKREASRLRVISRQAILALILVAAAAGQPGAAWVLVRRWIWHAGLIPEAGRGPEPAGGQTLLPGDPAQPARRPKGHGPEPARVQLVPATYFPGAAKRRHECRRGRHECLRHVIVFGDP